MMRNSAIECYRALLMLGICLLHVLGWAGLGHTTVAYLMMACVDGFVFISGWFGINFSWKKLSVGR